MEMEKQCCCPQEVPRLLYRTIYLPFSFGKWNWVLKSVCIFKPCLFNFFSKWWGRKYKETFPYLYSSQVVRIKNWTLKKFHLSEVSFKKSFQLKVRGDTKFKERERKKEKDKTDFLNDSKRLTDFAAARNIYFVDDHFHLCFSLQLRALQNVFTFIQISSLSSSPGRNN